MMNSFRSTLSAFLVMLCSLTAAHAHPNHDPADSLDAQAMGAIVVEYHRRYAAADSTAFELLAPAYSSFDTKGQLDPRRWYGGALLPAEFAGGWPDGSSAPEAYENDVTVVHVHKTWNRGIVITYEVGSFRGGSWEAYNAWLIMRVGDEWRIGAAIHELPEPLRAALLKEE